MYSQNTILNRRIVYLSSKTVFKVKYFPQITPTKFELPVQRHPLHQTISKYQGSGEYFTFFNIWEFFKSQSLNWIHTIVFSVGTSIRNVEQFKKSESIGWRRYVYRCCLPCQTPIIYQPFVTKHRICNMLVYFISDFHVWTQIGVEIKVVWKVIHFASLVGI